jgi:hypothetical protein
MVRQPVTLRILCYIVLIISLITIVYASSDANKIVRAWGTKPHFAQGYSNFMEFRRYFTALCSGFEGLNIDANPEFIEVEESNPPVSADGISAEQHADGSKTLFIALTLLTLNNAASLVQLYATPAKCGYRAWQALVKKYTQLTPIMKSDLVDRMNTGTYTFGNFEEYYLSKFLARATHNKNASDPKDHIPESMLVHSILKGLPVMFDQVKANLLFNKVEDLEAVLEQCRHCEQVAKNMQGQSLLDDKVMKIKESKNGASGSGTNASESEKHIKQIKALQKKVNDLQKKSSDSRDRPFKKVGKKGKVAKYDDKKLCKKCKKPGHVMAKCWFNPDGDNYRECDKCGKAGHFASRCLVNKGKGKLIVKNLQTCRPCENDVVSMSGSESE